MEWLSTFSAACRPDHGYGHSHVQLDQRVWPLNWLWTLCGGITLWSGRAQASFRVAAAAPGWTGLLWDVYVASTTVHPAYNPQRWFAWVEQSGGLRCLLPLCGAGHYPILHHLLQSD